MKPTAPRDELARVPDDARWEVVIVPVAQLTLDTPMSRRGFLGAGVTASAVLGALATGCGKSHAPNGSQYFCTSARSHTGSVNALAISPDGRTLASGSEDNTVKLWSMPDGALFRTLEGFTNSVYALAISPDGRILASGSSNTMIKLWSLPEGALLNTWAGHIGSVRALAISPDGKFLASGGNDNTIKLWRLSDGALLKTRAGHTDPIHALAISPDGKTLASGSGDKTIKLWRLPEGALLKTMTGHNHWVEALAISPDGKTLASGSRDKTIKLWSLPETELLKTLEDQIGWVHALAISPDGKTLASGSDDKMIRLWSLPEAELLKTLGGHTDWVHAIAISPDSKTLASGSGDKTIKLWGLLEGEAKHCLMDLEASPADVKGVTYQWRNEYGQIVSYTLPCGSPIPPGATCTCNCVPGSLPEPSRSIPLSLPEPSRAIPPSSPGRSWSEPCTPAPIPPGAICTCNCVPVCQAHRLLHSDPIVQTMAEEILLHMGSREFDYMHWAADQAESALQARIHQIIAAIDRGAKPDASRWPSEEACLDRLHDVDDVVATMAAQMLQHIRYCEFTALDQSLRRRIESLLSNARRRPWFVRYGPIS